MVSGGSGVLQRIREAWKWPVPRSTSARDGKGAVIFASIDEVLSLVYRPNLSVRDVCTEAAFKVNISPVALDFFTLVSEDGSLYLNPDKMLCEAECNQNYRFTLCIKACCGRELKEFDKQAFEYYFHQCRQDFLRGKISEFGTNQTELAKVVLYEIIFRARQRDVPPNVIISNPGRYGIKSLFQAGVFRDYSNNEIKPFLKEKIQAYLKWKDDQIKIQYITSLEKADDFFVHKLSFEKIYIVENVSSQRKFEVLVSAQFGIKKRRTDSEKNLPEDIVKDFSEVEALEFDQMNNKVTIIRKNCGPEILRASSPQAANSLVTLILGYYRLTVNQYKQLLRGQGSRGVPELLCHGPIMRFKAENILQHASKQDGSFLIRKSRSAYFSHVLSVYNGNEVNHYIIEQNTTGQPPTFNLKSDPTKGFSSLMGLIEHYKQSKDGFPVCLSKIIRPEMEGLSALLDREVLTPPPPDIQLVDPCLAISSEDLQIENPKTSLEGEFGEVRKGLWWCSNAEDRSLNVVSRAMVKPIAHKEKVKEYRKAMSTFLELKNQHLIQFYGITETPRALVFVFEFAGKGPLDDYFKQQSAGDPGLTKERVISYAAQIAEGMMFLHGKNCVHGRLSAHNVLVASEECVKISDHGLLHLVNSGQSFFPASRRGYGYSYCWFAPLSLQTHTFDLKSDIWSFGVTLWEMFALKRPFHSSFEHRVLTEEQVMSRYLKQRYLNLNRPNIPTKVSELIKRCWAPEPEDRPEFRDLVLALRSAEVPENEAEKVLLLPDVTELEDWEDWEQPPSVHPTSELESFKHRADSQASDDEYSRLAAFETQSSPNDYTNNLPGITVIPSVSLFNNTVLRKQSMTKTFSHPGLTQRSLEAEIAKEPVNSFALRKLSVSRASSCPPALQATNDRLHENSEQHTEPVEKPEAAAYEHPPVSVTGNTQARNEDVKLPDVPFLTKLEAELLGLSTETTLDTSSEGSDDGNDSSNNSDSGQNTEVCAEALAMMALGGIMKATGAPSNPVVDVCNSVQQRDDESNKHLAEHSSSSMPLSPDGVLNCDEESNLEESNARLPARNGSSGYVSVGGKAPVSSDAETTEPTPSTNVGAGSCVTIPSATQDNKAKGENISQKSSTVSNAVSNSISPVESSQRSANHINATCFGYSKTSLPKVENRMPESKVVVSARHLEESPYQRHLQMEEVSPVEDVGLTSILADEFLASFSNINQPIGGEAVDYKTLLSDVEGDSPTEGSSPLITDLQEDSDGNDTDSSSREDAESSLGRMFHTGFNRRDGNERESTLDPAWANFDFGLDVTIEEPPPAQKDDEDSHGNTQPPTRSNPENNALFMGFFRSENVDNHEMEPEGSWPEESQNIFSTPSLDQGLFLSDSAPTPPHPAMLAFGQVLFQQENNTDDWEENEQENDDDDDTSDNELFMSCGSVGYFPGKVHFLNSPMLVFDQGQENFEMREFPLNNLSKESMKTTELISFKDNQPASQGMSSNQLDETLSDDAFTFDDLGTDDAVEGNVEDSGSNSCKAAAVGHLKESTSIPEHSGGNGYTIKETQPVTNGNVSKKYRPTPDRVEQAPSTAISDSSSSDGIWPDSTGGVGRKASRSVSNSSWGEEQPTIQFDMNNIPPKLQIPFDQLHLDPEIPPLGQGQFGQVRQATWVYPDCRNFTKKEEVAVKVLKTTVSQRDSIDFVNEVKNMVELESKQECKFIIKLRGVSKDQREKLMLVTELAPHGALGLYLRSNKDILGTPQLLRFCVQICEGMEYLENQSLLHRDLAARNILVMREDLVKISDFGLSRLQEYYKLESNEQRMLPVKWYALESLVKGSFTSKSDVWSFGITMWEIFTYGGHPYGTSMETTELIKFLEDGKRLDCPDKCPENVYKVMRSCWFEDPMKRPSFFLLNQNYLKKCCPADK